MIHQMTKETGAQHADYCRLPWSGECTCAAGPTPEAVHRNRLSAVGRSVSVAKACWRCSGHGRIAVHEPLDGAFTWIPCPACQ